MKRFMSAALFVSAVTVLMTGCQEKAESVYLPVPPEIAGGPDLDSVPDDAVRVAVMSGTGSFEFPIYEGQRWYLVDEKADNVIKSGLATREGTLKVGRDGASINNQEVWDGNAENIDNMALYLMPRREQT